jgi:hypothetical protein
MRLMLIVVTVAVAMLLDLRVSQATQMPWCAVTNKSDFYNCSSANLRNVRAGGYRWQSRILQSEPVLPARIRAAEGQAEAMIHASSALGVGGRDIIENDGLAYWR